MATVDPLPISGQTVPVDLDSGKAFQEQLDRKLQPFIDKFLASQNPADLEAPIDEKGLADNEDALKQVADNLGVDSNSLVQKAQDEIERILSCDEKSYDKILNLNGMVTLEFALKQWRQLGCLIRPFIKQDDAKKQKNAARAFVRLLTAAKQNHIEKGDINEVVFWEGLVDLNAFINDTAAPVNETLLKEPPTEIRKIHQEAMEEVAALKLNLEDNNMLNKLHNFNFKIIEENHRNGLMRSKAHQWVVPLEFFHPQYILAAERYKDLEADPKSSNLVAEIQKLKFVVDEKIKRHHLASGWGIPSAEDYLKGVEEIKRIMSCSNDNDYEMLKITQDSDDGVKVKALRTITSMIHPIFSFRKDSKTALQKLLSAASRVGIEEDERNFCEDWTGEDWEDDENPPPEDPIEKPPQEILDLYKEASGLLLKLFDEPNNKQAKEDIQIIDDRVRRIEQTLLAQTMSDASPVWEFDPDWWYMHMDECAQYQNALRKNYDDEAAKNGLQQLGIIINYRVERHHLPDSLKLGTPEQYTNYLRNEEQEFKKIAQEKATDAEKHLSTMNDNLSKIPDGSAVEQTLRAQLEQIRDDAKKLVRGAETAVHESKSAAAEAQSSTCHFDAKLACEKAEGALARVSQMVSSMADLQVQALALVKDPTQPGVSRPIVYPWHTEKLNDGRRLIGYVRAGTGFQVCVEGEEKGRLIRRIIAGADIGRIVAEDYSKESRSKNMADSAFDLAGRNLGYKDIKDIHWVASATPKVRKDGKRYTSPTAYCCVALCAPDNVSLVTVTRLRKIAGTVQANEIIEKACREQQTPVPWEQPYQEIIYSASEEAIAKGGQGAPGTTLAPSRANGQAGSDIAAIETRLATLEGEFGNLKSDMKPMRTDGDCILDGSHPSPSNSPPPDRVRTATDHSIELQATGGGQITGGTFNKSYDGVKRGCMAHHNGSHDDVVAATTYPLRKEASTHLYLLAGDIALSHLESSSGPRTIRDGPSGSTSPIH
ncbi:hypothetical protein MRS44_003899 [Fusarium solani]|uniref:uncharacterized protein n=1 Tax=Fusarium solani TaxID=169388 RepID=UPI0032C4AE43|nr:hypothetical protein MRS44_003899 [Fusarium solani]